MNEAGRYGTDAVVYLASELRPLNQESENAAILLLNLI